MEWHPRVARSQMTECQGDSCIPTTARGSPLRMWVVSVHPHAHQEGPEHPPGNVVRELVACCASGGGSLNPDSCGCTVLLSALHCLRCVGCRGAGHQMNYQPQARQVAAVGPFLCCLLWSEFQYSHMLFFAIVVRAASGVLRGSGSLG